MNCFNTKLAGLGMRGHYQQVAQMKRRSIIQYFGLLSLTPHPLLKTLDLWLRFPYFAAIPNLRAPAVCDWNSWQVSLLISSILFLLVKSNVHVSDLMIFSGSQEGQGSPTIIKARQVWRWQAEEEGSCFLFKF